MSDYIRRSDALNFEWEIECEPDDLQPMMEGMVRVMDYIKQLPAADVVKKEEYDRLLENSLIVSSALQKYQKADVVEVVHGEWIHGREVSRDYVGDACVCIRYEKWWCSECNYTVDWGEPLWHYCPNCGAKMAGGDHDAAD